MLYRSISVAVILLLSWFAYSSLQSMQKLSFQLSDIQRSVALNAENLAADKLEINKKVSDIQDYIVSQKQLSKQIKQLESKLASQKKLTVLQATYSTVLKAETLRSAKLFKEAAKLLKSTKKAIWKAGDTYPDKQKILRALMPTIDAAVGAWNKGNSKVTAKAVYSALDKIIQEKGK